MDSMQHPETLYSVEGPFSFFTLTIKNLESGLSERFYYETCEAAFHALRTANRR